MDHAAGFVVRRLAKPKAMANITSEKPVNTNRQVLTSKTALAGNSSARSASVPYVNGLMRTSIWIHHDAPLRGNRAPESSHKGIRKRLMTAWKPCVESIGHAMQK